MFEIVVRMHMFFRSQNIVVHLLVNQTAALWSEQHINTDMEILVWQLTLC